MTIQSEPQYEIKVYKIWYEDAPEEFYIGSTKYDELYKRMKDHRHSARKGRPSRIYQTIREKGNDFKYDLVSSCMVSCRDEQNAFEQHWMDQLKPTLNMNRARALVIENIIKKTNYLPTPDDLLSWFNDLYEKADGEYIQLKDVWACFKGSDLYQNLNKAGKRIMNRAKMIENMRKNQTARCYYKEKHQPTVDGKQKCIKSVLIGYRMKIEEISDDKDDE
jgi:hypothetical protein